MGGGVKGVGAGEVVEAVPQTEITGKRGEMGNNRDRSRTRKAFSKRKSAEREGKMG